MMAYDNKFVLAILHNGYPIREINGKVSLPFHTDYKIRLKNKNAHLRCKARVWVDGRQVSGLGDFILHPNQTLDLERFVDSSLSSGQKFRFVPLGDGRVNDPTDPENGVIKVEFYKEKEPFTFKIDPPRRNPILPYNGDLERVRIGSKGFSSSSYAMPCRDISVSNCATPIYYTNSIASSDLGQAGATVEGGHSGQNFTWGDDFETEFSPVTLTLRLRGVSDQPITVNRSKQKKRIIRFCPSCGRKRRRNADHFCWGCGTAYHPRYDNERGTIGPR